MRFHCVELHFNFDSVRLAYIFENLGLTVIERGYCMAISF